MYTVLCYGDSNTWGYNPKDQKRYSKDIIWTSVLNKELGENFEVIVEGLNGRTTVWSDPIEGEYKNGKNYLLPCLHSHKPIDIVIIYLGANDFKYRFSVNAFDVAKSLESLVDIIENSATGPNEGIPEIIVVVPTKIKNINGNDDMFMGAEEKSRELSTKFEKVFKDRKCYLLDSNKIIETSNIDGIHLDEESHKILGKEISKRVKEIIKNNF